MDFNRAIAIGLEEGKLCIKTSCTSVKMTLCLILLVVGWLDKYKHSMTLIVVGNGTSEPISNPLLVSFFFTSH